MESSQNCDGAEGEKQQGAEEEPEPPICGSQVDLLKVNNSFVVPNTQASPSRPDPSFASGVSAMHVGSPGSLSPAAASATAQTEPLPCQKQQFESVLLCLGGPQGGSCVKSSADQAHTTRSQSPSMGAGRGNTPAAAALPCSVKRKHSTGSDSSSPASPTTRAQCQCLPNCSAIPEDTESEWPQSPGSTSDAGEGGATGGDDEKLSDEKKSDSLAHAASPGEPMEQEQDGECTPSAGEGHVFPAWPAPETPQSSMDLAPQDDSGFQSATPQ